MEDSGKFSELIFWIKTKNMSQCLYYIYMLLFFIEYIFQLFLNGNTSIVKIIFLYHPGYLFLTAFIPIYFRNYDQLMVVFGSFFGLCNNLKYKVYNHWQRDLKS